MPRVDQKPAKVFWEETRSNLMTIGKLRKVYGPLILLAGVLSVYVYFFSYLGSDYSPYYGDEYFYFKNSEHFYLSNSLQASFTYSGIGSKILGADAHGPAYPILYGSISKVFGWGGLTIPLVNLGILSLGLLFLICNKRVQAENRILQVLLILGSPITLFYSITYLPELLQLAGGIGLFLLVQRYLADYRREDFIILLLYIFILGSIRSTWFFAYFGLVVVPGPIKGFAKSGYLVAGIALAFLYQHFLHEQVPNTFSGFGEILAREGFWAGLDNVFFNIQRNIYFAVTFTEGHFYTVQKIWIASSILVSVVFCRKNKLIQFGLIVLFSMMAFNMILYKNYSWVDLRMYTPMAIFLNLVLISTLRVRLPVVGLIFLNLVAFILILPLQQILIDYRIDPDVLSIPEPTLEKIKNLDAPLVYVDSVLLHDYSIVQLPVLTNKGVPIRYILPYYSMPMRLHNYLLLKEEGQLNVKPVKILSQ